VLHKARESGGVSGHPFPQDPHFNCRTVQQFSQKSRTPTVAKEFQIGLYDPVTAMEKDCTTPQRPIWDHSAKIGIHNFWENCIDGGALVDLQPFSQKPRTPTVAPL